MDTIAESAESEKGLTFVLRGDIDTKTGPALKKSLEERIGNRSTAIYMDLSGVTYLDSSGLNILLTLHKSQVDRGKSLIVRRPSETVRRLLALSHLEHFFSIET